MVQQESRTFGLPDIVNVLVVGDPGVGKTSIISSLVNSAFNPDVPARLGDVTLKAELCPDNVPIRIIDSSELELQDREGWKKAVNGADVFCMVFKNDISLDRISSYWIPTLRSYETNNLGNYKPKILVANKMDQCEEKISQDILTSILRNNEDVVAFRETSAKTQNVELIYIAQQSVIYPIAPLFDFNMHTLTAKCRKALIEIFEICDKDNDGLINDQELNKLQEDCCGVPILKDALDDLKSIIKESIADGLVGNSLTKEGFLLAHYLLMDRGNASFTWKVLRIFNYDNQLEPKIDLKSLTLEDKVNHKEFNHADESFCLSIDDSKNQTYLTSSLSSTSQIEQEEESNEEEEPKEHFSGQVEVWLQDNKRIIKQSVGFTMATLVSMFALKFIVRNVIKTRF